ncbi:MAG: patatin-like phospholipase family protein [Myxococcales bacterium]|nr:patatin-like phospholipase family protein [Myxococcales bacterium]USN50176.1 MAG: patatin-like phospholipase family protein [Myxococcales bacterium]
MKSNNLFFTVFLSCFLFQTLIVSSCSDAPNSFVDQPKNGSKSSQEVKKFTPVEKPIANETEGLEAPDENYENQKLNPIKVLSLDGGGIRGVLLARLLQKFEQVSDKRIYELFDLIAGTSTGGLLSLLLTMPLSKDKLPLTVKEAEKFYKDNARLIFKYSCSNLIPKTVCSLRGPLYDALSMEALIQKTFGKKLFSESLIPTLLTTFSIEEKQGISLESDNAKFSHLNVLEVARATSAAPTFFIPKEVTLINSNNRPYQAFLIDGGIYKNNPAPLAFDKAERIFGRAEILRRGIVLVSIGTGKGVLNSHNGSSLLNAGAATWAPAVIDALIDGSSNEDEGAMENIFESLPGSHYIRIQTLLDNANYPEITELDSTTEKTIDLLLQAAEITKQSAEYQKALKLITNHEL